MAKKTDSAQQQEPQQEEPQVTAQQGDEEDLLDNFDDGDDGGDELDLSFLNSEPDEPQQETPAQEEPQQEPQAKEGEEEKKEEGTAAVAETGPAAESPPPQVQPEQQQPQQQTQEQVDGAAAQAEVERVALEKMSEYFTLSDDEVERFTTEPEKVLPQMAARVMLRTVQTSVEAIKALLPQVIAQHTEHQNRARQYEEQFYNSWPELKGNEEARPLLIQHAQLFRSMYPNASVEDVVKNVGASVMVAMGMQRTQPAPGPAAGEQAGGNGSQVVRRESLPPHKPAAATPPRELAPPRDVNLFEAMALEDD